MSATHVTDKIHGEIKTFLDEIINGTSNYRSLGNVAEQTAHQYHGRFLVELLQNAHDALNSHDASSRIEIALVDDDCEHSTLYVANDGKPFSHSNFLSLSNFAQSDKKPEESIGNKGLGFRSVLEISLEPRIFSRSSADAKYFDGFCFGFSPQVLKKLHEPLLDLLHGANNRLSLFGRNPLHHWTQKGTNSFRAKANENANAVGQKPEKWLLGELNRISPYQLPFPLEVTNREAYVISCEERGFATLICLPLKSAEARDLVRRSLSSFNAEMLLFLSKVSSLTILSEGEKREFIRSQTSTSLYSAQQQLTLCEKGNGGLRQFRFWEQTLKMNEAPDEVRAALQELPGNWKDLKEASIALAVENIPEPPMGTLSIFLPTGLSSGCAAHINGSFYGDLSRTNVDFAADNVTPSPAARYNCYLLSQAARLALEVISTDLAGRGIDEAITVVDLLAPCGDNKILELWRAALETARKAMGLDWNEAGWFLTDKGWQGLAHSNLLPEKIGSGTLTEQALRKHASVPLLHQGLNSRRTRLQALATNDLEIPSYALAESVESVAATLHAQNGADWNLFWKETALLFCGDFSPLRGRRVLACGDGQLHGEEGCTVFFPPTQGGSDDEDVGDINETREIPVALQSHVAFLHEAVHVVEKRDGKSQHTQTRNNLAQSGLVSAFRRETIFRDCLLPLIPPLPLPLSDPNAALCSGIMRWALRLAAELDKSILRYVGQIPVPCAGGWRALSTACFGPDWPTALVPASYEYLSHINGPQVEEARSLFLLRPSAREWGGDATLYTELLRKLGVRDGIPLLERTLPHCSVRNKYLELPTTSPDGYPPELWQQYRARTKPRTMYNSGKYEVTRILILPGLDTLADFDTDTAQLFMQAVFGSLLHWPENWHTSRADRTWGLEETVWLPLSPLAFALCELPWLVREEDVRSRPRECWQVRSETLRTQKKFFEHLRPLSLDMTKKLEANPRLEEAMRSLDLNLYDPAPEKETEGSRLLTALAHAVADSLTDASKGIFHLSSFLGQVNVAWRGFSSANALPQSIIVRRGAQSTLSLWTGDGPEEIYLPDTEQSVYKNILEFDKPVAVMETEAAKRLAKVFIREFPGKVIPLSQLRIRPIVDDLPWRKEGRDSLRDSEFSILLPYLLAIAAFRGSQRQGTGTKKFAELMATLRNARLCYAQSLAVEITGTDTSLPSQASAAWWDSESKTLLLRHDWSEGYLALADAFATMTEREDLGTDIQMLLMSVLPQWGDLSSGEGDVFTQALHNLRLTEEHIQQVLAIWQEDAAEYITWLEPLFMLTGKSVTRATLTVCDSRHKVEEFLHNITDADINGHILCELMRKTTSPFDFAVRLHEAVAPSLWNKLTLMDWNHCRGELGLQQSPLHNDDATEEFTNHRDEALPLLLCLCAWLFSRLQAPPPFVTAIAELSSIPCPADAGSVYWRVPFTAFLTTIMPLFENWGASAEECATLRQSASLDDLHNQLVALGISVACDPRERAGDNSKKMEQAVAEFRPICRAWAARHGVNYGPCEELLAAWSELPDFDVAAYLTEWSSGHIQSLLAKLIEKNLPVVAKALLESPDIASLPQQLDLTSDDLTQAKDKIAAQREESRRAKLETVCGVPFDPLTDGPAALWQHICTHHSGEAVSAASGVDLNHPGALTAFSPSRSSSSSGKGGKRGTTRRPMSNAKKELIGFAGEIHAFRMLQQQYGTMVITPAAWVSGNGKLAYPANPGDDGKGCDFEFALKGRKYHIEVKAAEEENEEFILGVSEVRLAERLAQKKSKKNTIFYILRVFNALSTCPKFELLPNPYEPTHKGKYHIDKGEARIRYRAAGKRAVSGKAKI